MRRGRDLHGQRLRKPEGRSLSRRVGDKEFFSRKWRKLQRPNRRRTVLVSRRDNRSNRTHIPAPEGNHGLAGLHLPVLRKNGRGRLQDTEEQRSGNEKNKQAA
ncbi:MAG: hypothetical protein HRU37_14455 [Roseibacillus sp.]|nr:hypothetical protein [Roseibacillus sp.]